MEINKEKPIKLAQWSEGNRRFRGVVKYGFSYHWNNSSPFFHITCNRFALNHSRWSLDRSGCNHDIILKQKPSLADLVTFHGWSQDGLPEAENVIHFYKCYRNWNTVFGNSKEYSKEERESYWQTFRQHTLLGVNETIPEIENKEAISILREWLIAREPYLKAQFHATMQKYEVEYITDQEVQVLNDKSNANYLRRQG